MIRTHCLSGLLATALLCSGVSAAHAADSSSESSSEEGDSEESDEGESQKSKEDGKKKKSGWGAGETDLQDESARRAQGDKNWSVSFSLGTSIGQGTFVELENNTNTPSEYQPLDTAFNSAQMSYGLSGSYRLDDFTFTGSIGWTQALTPASGLDDPNQIWFNDTSLNVNWRGYKIEAIDAIVSASAGFSLPTGLTSRQTSTKILGTGFGGSIRRTFFERLSLRLSMGAGKTFHRYKVPTLDANRIGRDNYLYDRNLNGSLVAIGGVNKEWNFDTGLSASVDVWRDLSASFSYVYGRSWSYYRDTDDQFQSPYADSGRQVGDIVSTSAGVSYPFEYATVNGSFYTQSRPMTSDQRSFNFPFWNFDGGASNESGFSLSLSASY